MWRRLLSDYGMLLVLLVLCAVLSVITYAQQSAGGAAGGSLLAEEVIRQTAPGARVLIVAQPGEEGTAFARALGSDLAGRTVVRTVRGGPPDARAALDALAAAGAKLDVVAATAEAGQWPLLQQLATRYPSLGPVKLLVPEGYGWPTFLRPRNLVNVADQIAVIAIMSIGMTLVILTGGIDLSVGSQMALSAVLCTLLIRDFAGAESASAAGMVAASTMAVLACGAVGFFNGTVVTLLGVPSFIVTLGMMLVASGLAYTLAENQSIFQIPESFTELGRGSLAGGIPNAVLLMLALYLLAHLVMSRTVLGRHIYAVGSNVRAARLSGLPVERVLILVYVVSGLLAGLGGVVVASQLKSGAPTYGQRYELYAIAAAVVGGTSLSGGEGTMFGTLIGAFLIAVIHNGMNLLGLERNTQEIVLGSVIIAAVLLDRVKRRGWLGAVKVS